MFLKPFFLVKSVRSNMDLLGFVFFLEHGNYVITKGP